MVDKPEKENLINCFRFPVLVNEFAQESAVLNYLLKQIMLPQWIFSCEIQLHDISWIEDT